MPSNFNSSTPAALAGYTNGTFQTDGAGNDSVCVPSAIQTEQNTVITSLVAGDVLVWNGSDWVNAAPPSGIFPTLSQPISTNFTWDNQGTATVSDQSNRMVVTIPDSSGLSPATQSRGLYEALPFAAPYTVQFALSVIGYTTGGNAVIASIGLRNSGGEWVALGLGWGSAGNYWVFRRDVWTTTTSFSGSGSTLNYVTPDSSLLWMRVTDDGTNRHFLVSQNGNDWLPIFSEGNTTTITPTEIGLLFYNEAGASGVPAVFSVYDYLAAGSVLPVIGT
jgi:hypothetical protein